MIDELQQGRVPIDQPQTGRLEYYQGKYHSTKKMLFTKVSAEQKAMQKIMTSMREQGMQIPEMLLKVGVRISCVCGSYYFSRFSTALYFLGRASTAGEATRLW